ncbi:AMP-binding protein [Salipiger bermudensis]|uniref:AMP-binding protein n=1 Tax=Salipiger bermudensis TaxID=344736 RepID=UPI001CD2F00A|nr:AMP-binding protein [Salipiger bermudensis]MCA1288409.1 AMP-binding protein [Salipiger bermudensis]
MIAATFHFHQDCRILQGTEDPLLGDLCAALRSGASFSIGLDRIEQLPGAARGILESRSSGTTGAAKAIRRSHGSWITSFEVNAAVLGITPRDTCAVLGAPQHSLALYAIAEAAWLGADLLCLGGKRPGTQATALHEAAATLLYATPTQLRLLCTPGQRLPSVRHILCGGGRMPEGLRARLAALCPNAALREFYGAAETSFIAWGDAATPEGAVGRAYPGVEIQIDAPEGAFGEIWVRSPYLFEGYAEGASADTRWRDGFVTVGEIGRLDVAGVLTVAGRRSRMVTVADQNVFPEDIEALLLADPEVAHCAVLPRPDPRRGVQLVAVIAGRCDAACSERLLALGRAALGPLAAPRRVIGMAEFPLTPSGKPDLRAIGRWLEAGA